MPFPHKFLRRLATILAALMPGACAPVGSPAPAPAPGGQSSKSGDWRTPLRESRRPAILFIGNSYTAGMPSVVRRIARAHGIPLRVGEVTRGGWTLRQHAAHPETLETIRGGGWDLVVLQEQSRLPTLSRSRRVAESHPAIHALAEEALAAGAVPTLYRTWARRDGDPDAERGDSPDDFFAMHARLTRGYREASGASGGLPILPVGDAWAHEVREGRGDRLFLSDGSHPTRAGVRLTARTIFFTCFPHARPKRGFSRPDLLAAEVSSLGTAKEYGINSTRFRNAPRSDILPIISPDPLASDIEIPDASFYVSGGTALSDGRTRSMRSSTSR